MLAIIGGSRLVSLPILDVTHRQIVRTPYGEPSCALTFGNVGARSVVFMARHGYGNSIAPHEINYRANLWALRHVGAREVIAIGSAGGIRPDMHTGSLVLPHDVLDYTYGRKHTLFEGAEHAMRHVDFSEPYHPALRQRLLSAAAGAGLSVVSSGVYACTQGPRLESVAEIRKLERDGADIVGMTGMPEAALAAELALDYAALCIVTNRAASQSRLGAEHDFSPDIIARSTQDVANLLKAFCI